MASEVGIGVAQTFAEEMVKRVITHGGIGRWIDISVKNYSGFVLEKVDEHFAYGRADNVPHIINPGQETTIAVTNGVVKGVKGILKYRLNGHVDNVYVNDSISACDLYAHIPKADTKDHATTHWGDSVYGVSSMTAGNDSTMGVGLAAGTVNAGGDEKSFQSFHNTYLRANKSGRVDLAPHCLEHEKWFNVKRDENKWSIRSVHGTYLSAKPDGHAIVDGDFNECGQWTLIPSGGKIGLKSCHGTYLSSRGDGQVDLVEECKEWERWSA